MVSEPDRTLDGLGVASESTPCTHQTILRDRFGNLRAMVCVGPIGHPGPLHDLRQIELMADLPEEDTLP